MHLLAKYPKSKRDLTSRLETKSEESRQLAKEFGKDYFDGDRNHGYGGFTYQSRFWQPVIPDIIKTYGLSKGSRALDIGCAKGFFIYDLTNTVPDIDACGIDISEYAINNSLESVMNKLKVGDAKEYLLIHPADIPDATFTGPF
jgi:SAM-dependent methyltransferase